MNVFSTIKKSELEGSLRIDAEYYQPEYLESKNIYELRFWNSEIEKNLENVLNKIKKQIKKRGWGKVN